MRIVLALLLMQQMSPFDWLEIMRRSDEAAQQQQEQAEKRHVAWVHAEWERSLFRMHSAVETVQDDEHAGTVNVKHMKELWDSIDQVRGMRRWMK